jgi:hypothetical protein
MNIKVSTLSAAVGVTTVFSQGIWGLVSGGFSVGSKVHELQSEIKLLRKDVQAQQAIYEFRLNLVEQRLSTTKK